VLLLGLFAILLGLPGAVATFAPARMVSFLIARRLRIRIGSFVPTTEENVRILGVGFLVFAVMVLAVLLVLLIDHVSLPFP